MASVIGATICALWTSSRVVRLTIQSLLEMSIALSVALSVAIDNDRMSLTIFFRWSNVIYEIAISTTRLYSSDRADWVIRGVGPSCSNARLISATVSCSPGRRFGTLQNDTIIRMNIVGVANARSKNLPPAPWIHHHGDILHILMEAFPALLVWRSVIDTGAILDEMWWDAMGSLVRIDKSPHEYLKLVVLKILSHFADTVINENKAVSSIVPYHRFLFGTAPT